MHRHLLLSLLFLLTVSTYVAGEECDLTIRDGSAAQDLSRILHCFDQRMKKMEAQLSVSGNSPRGAPGTRNPAEYDAGVFTVAVRSTAREEYCIRVGLSVRNKTTEKIFLAIDFGGEQTLIDEEKGIAIALNSSDGLRRIYKDNKREDAYSQIPSNAVQSVSLRFCSNPFQSQKSRQFNMPLPLLHLKNQQVESIAVPLSVTFKDN